MSRKSLDPNVWRTKNKEFLRDPKITKEATVWFWKYIPDPVILALGYVFLFPALPLFVTMIGGSEIVWFALLRLVEVFPWLRKIPNLVHSFACRIGKPFMKDERDAPFFLPVVVLTVWTPAMFCYCLWRNVHYGFEISTMLMYHALRLLPRYRLFAFMYVLLHKEGHYSKGFFKWEWANWGILNYFSGMFYGDVPNSFPIAHNKIHHAYDNDLDDVHTNLDLDRSKPISFIYYVPRFALYWSGITPIIKFVEKNQWGFAAQMAMGMVFYYSIWYFFFTRMGFWFTLYYVCYPHIESVTFFGLISYLWHAWCDSKDINNPFVDSVTIIEGQDNIFNEDYHVVHHTKPNLHWTEYPECYQQNIEHYRNYNATIFRDCEEGQLLYWLLSGKWDTLAEHWVDLTGKMTHEDKKQLCLDRLRTRLDRN